MTITLSVREVLHDPARFVSNWRLAVDGVLLLGDEDFRLFHFEDEILSENVSLTIVDPFAAAKLREALPQPLAGRWWYFGRALVQAWTRRDLDGWSLHEVVSIYLNDVDNEPSYNLKIRPSPWDTDESTDLV